MDGLNCLGADVVGEEPPDPVQTNRRRHRLLRHRGTAVGADAGYMKYLGPVFQAAGGLAQGAIDDSDKGDAQVKSAADDKKAADAAIAADKAASLAAARAATSVQLKMPSAQIDTAAAGTALAAQDRAGAGLSSSASDLRAAAADAALAAATMKAQSSPKDVYSQQLVAAWTATANKAHSGSIANLDKKDKVGKGDKESWLTRRVVGPIPGYGVLGIGAGVLGAIGYAAKRIFF